MVVLLFPVRRAVAGGGVDVHGLGLDLELQLGQHVPQLRRQHPLKHGPGPLLAHHGFNLLPPLVVTTGGKKDGQLPVRFPPLHGQAQQPTAVLRRQKPLTQGQQVVHLPGRILPVDQAASMEQLLLQPL